MTKFKILFLAANPTDTSALRLDKECREVGERIRLAEHRDRVELVSRWAVRTDDVIQALLEEKPHVVHFSGHGETSGLVLEDSQGKSRTVTPEALVAVFQAIPDNLRLAVFNACDSLPLAKAAVKVLAASIGMKRPSGTKPPSPSLARCIRGWVSEGPCRSPSIWRSRHCRWLASQRTPRHSSW